MNKHIVRALFALGGIGALAAGVTGCDDTSSEAAPETTKVEPTPVAVPTTADPGDFTETLYLIVMNDEEPTLTDQRALDAGYYVCGQADRGVSFWNISMGMMENGWEPTMIGSVIGASTNSLCDQHSESARTFAQSITR